MRERRGPIGSDSENPLVLLGPVIVESVGVEVILEIGLAIVAAIATVVDPPEKDPKEECHEEFLQCLMTDLADQSGHQPKHTRSRWCEEACVRANGVWPSRTLGPGNRTVSCAYWKK